MTRNTSRPARQARRGAPSKRAAPAPAEPVAAQPAVPPEPAAVAEVPAAVAEVVPAAVAEVVPADPAVVPPAPAPSQVALLAFRYFAESGFRHGQALDHWLRAETELTRRS